ncbi:tRNA methyltransferase ppm2 [Elasticomyces elasticus]|nr:tRNA methyltransferase ppm2 [Elasticomyces elasticus]
MYENDPVQATQSVGKTQAKRVRTPDNAAQIKRDESIMDTNSSSIVSKRSVEKLYHTGEPEYFRYFVKKFQRRSPLINRGYWLRMRAIDHVVRTFLNKQSRKRKVVVNLGCGYDPLPFQYLGKHSLLCQDVTFVDVDYSLLMLKKLHIIASNPPLLDLLQGWRELSSQSGVLGRADHYLAVGCNLCNVDELDKILQSELNVEDCSVLFVAEVSIAYMDRAASDTVLRWAAGYDDVQFCVLEQHLPDGADHPFARTMLKHFEKLQSPLRAISTMEEQRSRYVAAGWPDDRVDVRSLWDLWTDSTFLTAQQRQALDAVEPFDEWEEFALFAAHYFLLVATKTTDSRTHAEPNPTAGSSGHIVSENVGTVSNAAIYYGQTMPEPHSQRRFSAQLPSLDSNGLPNAAIALHGGLGTRERLSTCDVWTAGNGFVELKGPPMRSALMCHTITKVAKSDCLLVGGRTSPDKASAECWYRKAGMWERVQNLREGRYRHSAAPIGDGVLVYGGKTSGGEILDEWLYWEPQNGWQEVQAEGEGPRPRFGAAMCAVAGTSTSGILVGGMARDGTVLDDVWNFDLFIFGSEIYISERKREDLGSFGRYLGRFGATLLSSEEGIFLVGGVTGQVMLKKDYEILDLKNKRPLNVHWEHRPLLVGCHTIDVEHGHILVVGGGATCFSFGTFWSPSTYLSETPAHTTWHLQGVKKAREDAEQFPVHGALPQTGSAPTITRIPRLQIRSGDEFAEIIRKGRPVILSDFSIGGCTQLWTNEYLKERIGADREVVVHHSPSTNMNFQTKNFSYETKVFGDFLDAASTGEKLYLRTLSVEQPSVKVTKLETDFPSIADDFILPTQLQVAMDNLHSSPLRISGMVNMWLHYDVMANVLCQIRGAKRMLLYPPSDVKYLSFPPGMSSSSLDIFAATHITHPSLVFTHPHEALLGPGDILFLPSLWLHAASPIEGLSVAVNVFFRDLEDGYAAGRDVYGNRDLQAYEKGRKDIEKITRAFEALPLTARKFYLERLGMELLENAREKDNE